MDTQLDKMDTTSSAVTQTVVQTVVMVDEYGDPVIQGPYAGQEPANLDALLPGRKLESEEEAAADDDQADLDLDENQVEAEHLLRQRQQIRMAVSAFLCVWILAGGVLLRKQITSSIRDAAVVAGSAETGKPSAIGRSSIPDLLRAGADYFSSGDYAGAQSCYQRAVSIANNKSDSDTLVAFADGLVNKGQPRAAELFYRRALSILGASEGTTSRDYLYVITKLSWVLHITNRYQEEDDLNAYLIRLTQAPS